jgi:hypothetical protein
MWKGKFSTPASRFYFQTSNFRPQNCSADFANTMGYVSRIMYSSCKLWSQLSIQFYFPNRKRDYYSASAQCWIDTDKFSHFKLEKKSIFENFTQPDSLNEGNDILLIWLWFYSVFSVYVRDSHNILNCYGVFFLPNLNVEVLTIPLTSEYDLV